MAGISVVVAVRDESQMLPGCLRRLAFADELIVVVDDRTTDESAAIAQQAGARLIPHEFSGFADLKNAGLSVVQNEWTLVVDADERVGPRLAAEIQSVLGQRHEAFRVPILNYFYAHKMRWGGWQERPIRLLRTGSARYVGDLHETLKFERANAEIGVLTSPLHHFSHRSVLDNLHKTASYADVYAHSQLPASPRVNSARLYWVAIREILYRLIWKQGWRDGVPGTIESLYQPLSVLAVHARLWELQQHPTVDEQYLQLEELIE